MTKYRVKQKGAWYCIQRRVLFIFWVDIDCNYDKAVSELICKALNNGAVP